MLLSARGSRLLDWLTRLDTSRRFWSVLLALVCAILSSVFLISRQPDRPLASGERPAHRYSAHEPEWAQLAFPLLGVPSAPPTSPTSVASLVARSILPDTGGRLAAPAVLFQVIALCLFSLVLLDLGIHPAISAAACVILAFQPTFFTAATSWTPYMMWPGLVLGILVARPRWMTARNRRWAFALGLAVLLSIAESVSAIAVLCPLLLAMTLRGWPLTEDRRSWKSVAAVAGLLAAGFALQVVGAAMAWRAALVHAPAASWRDAFVAVTTRWGRLLEIYARAPTSGSLWDGITRNLGSVGLLGILLAGIGAVCLSLGRQRRESALLLAMLAVAVIADAWLVPPVSSFSAAHSVVAILIVVFVAAGLAQMVALSRSAGGLLFLGIVLVVQGLAARYPSASSIDAIDAVHTAGLPAGIPVGATIVASDVESDRQMADAGLFSPTLVRRIPQTERAIRQAKSAGGPVLVRQGDVSRLRAMGWTVAADEVASTGGAKIYRLIERLPCVEVGSSWSDVTAPAMAAGVGLETDRAAPYVVDLQADPTSVLGVEATDTLDGVALDVIRTDAQSIRLAVERPRRSMPIVHFDRVPLSMRARLVTGGAERNVRVCGAAIEGGGVDLISAREAQLRLDHDSIFAHGWLPVEPLGPGGPPFRWTDSLRASTLVQLPGSPEDLEITIACAPAAPVARRPTVTLEFNGQRLQSREMVASSNTYSWTISRSLVRQGLNVAIFEVSELVTPRALGMGADTRTLGLSVSSVRLRRLGQ